MTPRTPAASGRVGVATPVRRADERDRSSLGISSALRTPSVDVGAVSGSQMSRLERMYERVTASERKVKR